MEKNIIASKFKKLERFGFLVKNLGSRKAVSKGATGLPDIIVIGKRNHYDIHWIEVKIGADKLSPEQKEVREYLMASGNYYLATEKNFNDVIEAILTLRRRIEK